MYKQPKFLSPTALGLWQQNQEEFFVKYMCFERPPRPPQTKPMSVGSAFDAEVKVAISKDLTLDLFQYEELFEKQVEPQNRDFAREAGRVTMQAYRDSGVYWELLRDLADAQSPPRMEFTESGNITEHGQLFRTVNALTDDAPKSPVVLLGIPDLCYTNKQGFDIVHDWKVNGYCSAHGISPARGYICISDGWNDDVESRKNGQAHNESCVVSTEGWAHNALPNIEQHKPDWGRQLSVYSWLTGQPVGGDFYISIDQLACARGKVRVAQHRCPVSNDFQRSTYDAFQTLWNITRSNHIFRDVSMEESMSRCAILLQQAKAYEVDWFAEMMKPK